MSAPTPIPVPKGFQRLGPFPLDPTSVFTTFADFQNHAAGGTSYAGQICAVVSGSATNIYRIEADKSFTELLSSLDLEAESQARAAGDADLQTQINGKQPTGNYVSRSDVQGGGSSFFERSGNAASQNVGQGNSVHQIVLSNDTRLTDARTPTPHDHAISDVTGLTDALDGKQPTGSYATLINGLVPASQLPSYVDDVLEFANLAAFPATGESGKIYVTLTTPPKAYRWSGSAYLEISPSEVTSVAGKTGAVDLYLEDLTNFSSLAASAYKLSHFSHEVTSASSLGLSSTSGRAQAWTVTFRAAVAYDFFLPNTVIVSGQFMHGPQLGDIVTINFLTAGQNSTPWTARFKRPDLSTFFTVTSADSDLKKSNLRFVYDGSAWQLDKAIWHEHRYSELLDTPPDVATGYFDRTGDATSRPPEQGQAPHQVVLANDTRLIDPRRVAWVTKPASPSSVVSGSQPGTMAYDGSFLYILVPTPGSQSLRWARTPLSMTW